MNFKENDFPESSYETFGDPTGILKEIGENYKNMSIEEIHRKLDRYFAEIPDD